MDQIDLSNQAEVLQALTLDSNYYGDLGKKYLSYSDVGTLLDNPEKFKQSKDKTVPMVVGGYFHTIICEPDKVDSFKIIDATTRNTKLYKELSDGEVCLLQHEADKIELMRDKLLSNTTVRDLIQGDGIEYEKPQIGLIKDEMWKGKADIINHNEKLIIDLKTTGDIQKFRYSAKKFHYNAQAYVYQQLFGYEFVFVAIDKNTNQVGIYDCSPDFINDGEQKVINAIAQYRLFFKNEDFDPLQYFINETL